MYAQWQTPALGVKTVQVSKQWQVNYRQADKSTTLLPVKFTSHYTVSTADDGFFRHQLNASF